MRSTTQFTFSALPLLLAPAGTSLQAQGHTAAQTTAALKAVVEKTVSTKPEVTSRFDAYRAALDAVGVGSSAYEPK